MIPIMWSFGSTVGYVAYRLHRRQALNLHLHSPALGGVLASPATQWPQSFGKIAFFHDYPYFLACAAAGLFAFVAFVLSYIGLKEVFVWILITI